MIYTRNDLLASFSRPELEALAPHLSEIRLESKRILHEAGDLPSQVYFPFDAVISMVIVLSDGGSVEGAMVGRDGAAGASSALDGKCAVSRAVVQIGGSGAVCDGQALRQVALKHPRMLFSILNRERMLFAQAQQSAACNAMHEATARLCRWLLRARDLSGHDTLLFTQEYLAEMLGVRRSTLSVVAHTIQAAGMISYHRGKITILDLDGLREGACECYETVEKQYDQLKEAERPTNW
jgi:CRP-like cAMP-binding protein